MIQRTFIPSSLNGLVKFRNTFTSHILDTKKVPLEKNSTVAHSDSIWSSGRTWVGKVDFQLTKAQGHHGFQVFTSSQFSVSSQYVLQIQYSLWLKKLDKQTYIA